MSFYIESSILSKGNPDQGYWKASHTPGETVPVSGIYRCTGCRKEIAANAGDPLPPQNKHQHADEDGPIEWKLNVRAKTS